MFGFPFATPPTGLEDQAVAFRFVDPGTAASLPSAFTVAHRDKLEQLEAQLAEHRLLHLSVCPVETCPLHHHDRPSDGQWRMLALLGVCTDCLEFLAAWVETFVRMAKCHPAHNPGHFLPAMQPLIPSARDFFRLQVWAQKKKKRRTKKKKQNGNMTVVWPLCVQSR